MKKRIAAVLMLSVSMLFLLCACTHSSYTQEDIGEPKEPVTAETILGRWYFEGHKTAFIDFNEDGTYVTNNEGQENKGTYQLSEDLGTLHLKEGKGIDDDVTVMYGDDILYLVWQNTREQLFTRTVTEEK